MTEPNGLPNDHVELSAPERATAARQPRFLVRLVGLVLVIASVVLATYLIVAYIAYESGQTQRTQQETAARAEQIGRQLELARQDLAGGSPNLALTRLDWVLEREPANGDALALRDLALAADATPMTPEPTSRPQPTTEAAPDEPAADTSEAQAQLATIRRLVTNEQWEESLPLLAAFQQQYPDYERQQTDQMLYDTYVGLGLTYVNTEKVEMGLNYFAQAERLGALPPEAQTYRAWADLYFQGIAYSGVNWEIATGYWRDLCAAAPFYRDACRRLQRSLVGYGDQLAYIQDWCPAIDIYQEAWNQAPSESLEGKLNAARENCFAATPVSITGTQLLTGDVPITGTNPLAPTEPGG